TVSSAASPFNHGYTHQGHGPRATAPSVLWGAATRGRHEPTMDDGFARGVTLVSAHHGGRGRRKSWAGPGRARHRRRRRAVGGTSLEVHAMPRPSSTPSATTGCGG